MMEKYGWMACSFKALSAVFQSYGIDGRVVMKSCVQRSPVYGSKKSASARLEGWPLAEQGTILPIELLGLVKKQTGVSIFLMKCI